MSTSNVPEVPGFGVAGQVMCPFSMMAPRMCMKQGCELWVELKCGESMVARCSLAWLPVLSVELRTAVTKLGELNGNSKVTD